MSVENVLGFNNTKFDNTSYMLSCSEVAFRYLRTIFNQHDRTWTTFTTLDGGEHVCHVLNASQQNSLADS